MHLRENLRGYVAKINAEAAATGMPMLRPMFLQWPLDAGAQTAAVEDQVRGGEVGWVFMCGLRPLLLHMCLVGH